MRIRQVKPSFWTDSTLSELPRSVRLTYIGLWMLADDGGWLREDIPQIANELYGYENRQRREKAMLDDLSMLEVRGRILRLECGHDYIPKMTEHQRLAGQTKQVHTVEREHDRCVLAGNSGDPHTPARLGKVSKGQSSKGQKRASASDTNGGPSLKDRLAANGLDIDTK